MFVENMRRSNPPSRGETKDNRTMTGNLRNQIQLWEEISDNTNNGNDSKNDITTTHNKNFRSANNESLSPEGFEETSSEPSSPNVVLRSKVA